MLTASGLAAGIVSLAAQTAKGHSQLKESEKSRPREPLPSASCFGSTALPGCRTSLQGNTLSAFFSLDSGSAPTPDYLCPSFLTDINSPLASPPMLAGFPKAKSRKLMGWDPLWGAGWGALMVCVPTGSSLSTLKSAWSLSDLHSPPPPPPSFYPQGAGASGRARSEDSRD